MRKKRTFLCFTIMLVSFCLITTGCLGGDDDDDNNNNAGGTGSGAGTVNIVTFTENQIQNNTFFTNDPVNLDAITFNNTENEGDPNAGLPVPN